MSKTASHTVIYTEVNNILGDVANGEIIETCKERYAAIPIGLLLS